ncbi:MHS family MFS transporter [Mycobacterium leprae]|uniref:MHS family MFS transporter n=1 Tax=Mycobacterium leprae TaxID=1769 RepID=UPI00030479CC|nr:MHS family MFS transporter [Mycobacterium leprae]
MKRVALTTPGVGSSIEFYNAQFISPNGTVVVLVFPSVFFANLAPAMATVSSPATFAAVFFSPPLLAGIFS